MGDLPCVKTDVRQDAVGTDDGCSRWHIFGDDGVGADRDPATHGHAAENFCPGSDVNPVFNDGRAGRNAPAAQSDLMANHHIPADLCLAVDNDALRMG